MCGITGFASATTAAPAPADRRVLERMTASLAHRGPDGEGLHVTGDGRVALGHRRLAVIDRDGGAQPMRHEAAGLTIVFNGEIYNYRRLNDELARLGHVPRTRSDTETILLAYAAWGPACVDRLNGMFAFVIHDAENERLFGARDPVGKKPLYYAHDRDFLAFASEPRALLEHPRIGREIDLAAAAHYLVFEHVPAPRSIWRGVSTLLPGHRFVFDLRTGRFDQDRYWAQPLYEPVTAQPEHWCERIRRTLDRAVERRLVADVPLGVFLSGGLDSAAVTAVMARRLGASKVRTFSIGFVEAAFDEGGAARRFAERLGTDHHEFRVTPRLVMDLLPEAAGHLDEPFADASVLPTMLLARQARKHVTVALGGDGGDELFAGYQTFQALAAARLYRALVPDAVHRHVVTPLAGRIRARAGYFALDFKVKQFLRGAKAPPCERLWRWLGAFTPEGLAELLTPEALAAIGPFAPFDERHAGHGRDAVAADSRVYLESYLADGILTKLDRATMAAGLEARSPLLDVEMIELAARIPGRLKVRRGRAKHIFRQAVAPLLPPDLLERPKHGFALPVGAWLRGPLRELLMDTLDPRALRDGGLLRPEAVRRLVDEHAAGRHNHRKPLFCLLMLELWRRHWTGEATRHAEPLRRAG